MKTMTVATIHTSKLKREIAQSPGGASEPMATTAAAAGLFISLLPVATCAVLGALPVPFFGGNTCVPWAARVGTGPVAFIPLRIVGFAETPAKAGFTELTLGDVTGVTGGFFFLTGGVVMVCFARTGGGGFTTGADAAAALSNMYWWQLMGANDPPAHACVCNGSLLPPIYISVQLQLGSVSGRWHWLTWTPSQSQADKTQSPFMSCRIVNWATTGSLASSVASSSNAS